MKFVLTFKHTIDPHKVHAFLEQLMVVSNLKWQKFGVEEINRLLEVRHSSGPLIGYMAMLRIEEVSS
jgi:hypothetical protein